MRSRRGRTRCTRSPPSCLPRSRCHRRRSRSRRTARSHWSRRHVNAGAQNRVPCVTSSSAACLSRPSLSKVRTCPVSGAFIVHVYQVSITAHSFPSIFEGNGTTCLCFVSSPFLATTPFTPVCNVFWSSAVHPLRMVYWSATHRSRTSSGEEPAICKFSANAVGNDSQVTLHLWSKLYPGC